MPFHYSMSIFFEISQVLTCKEKYPLWLFLVWYEVDSKYKFKKKQKYWEDFLWELFSKFLFVNYTLLYQSAVRTATPGSSGSPRSEIDLETGEMLVE